MLSMNGSAISHNVDSSLYTSYNYANVNNMVVQNSMDTHSIKIIFQVFGP